MQNWTHNFYKLLRGLALIGIALLLPSLAAAQSACTAMWGIADNDAGGTATVYSLRYFNSSTNQWSTPVLTLTNGANGANALAGSPAGGGRLYYVNRTTRELREINLNANPITDTLKGVIPVPPVAGANNNILGATFDTAGNLYVVATSGSTVTYVAGINTVTAALSTPWTTVLTSLGATPAFGGSGDIYFDAAGISRYISNTGPNPTLYSINLTPGPSFGQVGSPGLVLSQAGTPGIGGISVDPATGITYTSGNNASANCACESSNRKYDWSFSRSNALRSS